MTHHLFSRAAFIVAISASFIAIGCMADIHDNVVHIDATLQMSTDVDVNHLHAGDAVPLTLSGSGLDDDGHFEFYFDDTDSDAIMISVELQVVFTVPADAEPGSHGIICRRHKKDGTATDLEFNLAVTIE